MPDSLPEPTFQKNIVITDVISEFRNEITNAASIHAVPEGVTTVKGIKVSVELPLTALENTNMWIFKSNPSGYALFKYVNLNSTNMPGFRTYYDFSDGINHLSLSSDDRIVISLRPNGALTGAVKAITIAVTLTNENLGSGISVYDGSISWPFPP